MINHLYCKLLLIRLKTAKMLSQLLLNIVEVILKKGNKNVTEPQQLTRKAKLPCVKKMIIY